MADPILGEIRTFAFGFVPSGWAACDGQVLPINQNQALFALLGTTYGGDGRTTFARPDLRGRGAGGRGAAPTGPASALGEAGGEEAHRLSAAELPGHRHQAHAKATAGTRANPTNAVWAASAKRYASSGTAAMSPDAIGSAGGGPAPHNKPPQPPPNRFIARVGE